jgi:hypothetical protein
MPQLIKFHLADFFPDLRFWQFLGGLADPSINADIGDAEQLSQPSETGLAEAVEKVNI